MDSVMILQARFDEDPTTVLTWDKDDTDAMDFVAGASILRAQLFHLPGAEDLTRFLVKSLAGNIIPAIATTNAIIAGLMVLQAKQVLTDSNRRIRTVYLHRHPTGRRGNRRLVVPCEPAPPNPNCLVCSHEATKSKLNLVCDPASLSLRVLRDRILIRHLGMLAPDVELEERGVILISSEEGETDEDTLNKTLAEFQVIHGSRLQCDDFRQDFNLRLIISAVPAAVTHAPIDGLIVNTTESHDVTEGWRLVGDLDMVLADAHTKPTTVYSNLKPTERLRNGVGPDATEVTHISIDGDRSATESYQPITGRAIKRHLFADSDKQSASSHEHVVTEDPAMMLKRGRFDSGGLTSPIAPPVHDVEDEDDFVFLD
ncbi:ubiquitin-like 1-activating enzyme E1 B [Paragonimus westermani]|uniref:Ubiquitin-like 1-activating enzyme E1 B n=1 Tax=Paragonimus westermani TaxID=34504 RepID=A0A5J4NLZ7_9TREM|nr:ubiquitin-like 1-activating enzyme E1 B [Paragonimus westermani]